MESLHDDLRETGTADGVVKLNGIDKEDAVAAEIVPRINKLSAHVACSIVQLQERRPRLRQNCLNVSQDLGQPQRRSVLNYGLIDLVAVQVSDVGSFCCTFLLNGEASTHRVDLRIRRSLVLALQTSKRVVSVYLVPSILKVWIVWALPKTGPCDGIVRLDGYLLVASVGSKEEELESEIRWPYIFDAS